MTTSVVLRVILLGCKKQNKTINNQKKKKAQEERGRSEKKNKQQWLNSQFLKMGTSQEGKWASNTEGPALQLLSNLMHESINRAMH